ncbi:hypothetical protein ACPF8X_03165 [Streptomyces sp. G35A]
MPEGNFDAEVAAVQARTFAIMALVLDGQAVDMEQLLDDLSPKQLADVVHGLASMALLSMLKREDRRDPEMRARLGVHLRELLLERQARAQG